MIHRDDVDLDDVKRIEDIFAQVMPGHKIVFAGDQPEGSVPESVLASVERVIEAQNRSLHEGTCLDCGRKMEWSDEDAVTGEDGVETVVLPDGWQIYSDGVSGEPAFFVCPDCDSDEESERILTSTTSGEAYLLSDRRDSSEEEQGNFNSQDGGSNPPPA